MPAGRGRSTARPPAATPPAATATAAVLAGAPADTSASATGATTSRLAVAAAAVATRTAAARAPRALRTGSQEHRAHSERWLRSTLRSSEVIGVAVAHRLAELAGAVALRRRAHGQHLLAQVVPRAEQQGLDGADRHRQPLGHLGVGELADLAQVQHRALGERQLLQRRAHLGALGLGQQPSSGAGPSSASGRSLMSIGTALPAEDSRSLHSLRAIVASHGPSRRGPLPRFMAVNARRNVTWVASSASAGERSRRRHCAYTRPRWRSYTAAKSSTPMPVVAVELPISASLIAASPASSCVLAGSPIDVVEPGPAA